MADDKETDDQSHEEVAPSPDGFFEPVVILMPEVTIVALEEDEDEEMLRLRGKLYRYCSAETPPEWKERGTGEVKILKHKKRYRILMRRDKTLKICANHIILPCMDLKPNCGSDRAWVWSTPADFADEEPKVELLALRFGNAENAKKFKEVFDACRDATPDGKEGEKEEEEEETTSESEGELVDREEVLAEQLKELSVKDSSGDEKTCDATKPETSKKET